MKKSIMVLLLLITVILLGGCSNGKQVPPSSSSTKADEEPVVVENPTPTEEASNEAGKTQPTAGLEEGSKEEGVSSIPTPSGTESDTFPSEAASPIPFPTELPTEAPTPTPEGEYYTITVKVEPEGAGTATGGGTYQFREKFILEAIPAEGYEFSHWSSTSGDFILNASTTSRFTIGNVTYTAWFKEVIPDATPTPGLSEIKVLAFPAEGGTVKGNGVYEYGAEHIVEAIPNRGWVFDGWSSYGKPIPDTSAVQRFYAVGDCTYVANFKKMEVTPTPLPEVDEVVWTGKLGPNVTGTFWSNGTYVVSGEGATYDYWFDQPHNKKGQMLEYIRDVRKIVVEEGITRIGTYALSWFEECREIVLPKSLKEIGKRAFERCGKRGYWGDANFVGYDNITPPKEQWFMKVNLQDTSVTHLGPRAFWATTYEDIVLPDTLERIDDEVFGYCQERADCMRNELIIPANVKQLGQYVFYMRHNIICLGKSSIKEYKLVSEYYDLTEETIVPFPELGTNVTFRP